MKPGEFGYSLVTHASVMRAKLEALSCVSCGSITVGAGAVGAEQPISSKGRTEGRLTSASASRVTIHRNAGDLRLLFFVAVSQSDESEPHSPTVPRGPSRTTGHPSRGAHRLAPPRGMAGVVPGLRRSCLDTTSRWPKSSAAARSTAVTAITAPSSGCEFRSAGRARIDTGSSSRLSRRCLEASSARPLSSRS